MSGFVEPPIPSNISEVPDLLKAVRELRLAMQKETDKVEAFEKKLKAHLVDTIPRGSRGVFGLAHKAELTEKYVPIVGEEGWPQLQVFIAQTGRFDLIQKRLNPAAVAEALELDQSTGATKYAIPGISKLLQKDISLTKIG